MGGVGTCFGNGLDSRLVGLGCFEDFGNIDFCSRAGLQDEVRAVRAMSCGI